MIDRDELYKALASWDWQDLYLPVHFKELVDDLPVVRHSYEDGIRKGYEDAVRNYAKMALKQWIPVGERLPEPVAQSQRREWFITSNQYGGVTLTCFEFEASPFKEGWQTDMTILAWMPLPEPWEGEEDE